MAGEPGIAERGIEEEVGQVDADGERDPKQGENLTSPADRDDANEQQAHQGDDHDDENRVEKEEHRERQWDQRVLIDDREQHEGGSGEQQAQHEEPHDLHHHPAGEHAFHRARCGEQHVEVGVEQQGVEAEHQAAEDQHAGISKEGQAQQVKGVDPYRHPVGGLHAEPGDKPLP